MHSADFNKENQLQHKVYYIKIIHNFAANSFSDLPKCVVLQHKADCFKSLGYSVVLLLYSPPFDLNIIHYAFT